MVDNYRVLRIRKIGNKLECELADPSTMQIISVDRRTAEITDALDRIPVQYQKILKIMRTEQPDVRRFNQELNWLQTHVSTILGQILEGFDIDFEKEEPLGLALDEATVRIPWELGLVKLRPKTLFCDKLKVGRLRAVKEKKWWNNPNNRRTDRALVVALDYDESLSGPLKEVEKICTILEVNRFKVRTLIGKSATKEAVMREMNRGVDIFHFAGHGNMCGTNSSIDLYDGKLSTKMFYHKSIVAPSLSFLNACETSAEDCEEEETVWNAYNWATALARGGGRVVIGTLWPVMDATACTFAMTFYQEFLGGARRKSLAGAMNEARKRTKEEKSKYADCTWPAFVLYGPPTLKLDDLLIRD